MAGKSTFTQEMADRICEEIADGKSLREICLADDMPNRATVFKWLADHETFSDQYAHAKEEQADCLFDEVLEIADNSRNDWMVRNGENDPGWQLNGDHIQRAKLRIDARKWMAGKLRPKKYGDKVMNEVSGPDGGEIKTVTKIELVAVPASDSSSD